MLYEVDLCVKMEIMNEKPVGWVEIFIQPQSFTYRFPVCPENTLWMKKYICFDETCESLEIHIIE